MARLGVGREPLAEGPYLKLFSLRLSDPVIVEKSVYPDGTILYYLRAEDPCERVVAFMAFDKVLGEEKITGYAGTYLEQEQIEYLLQGKHPAEKGRDNDGVEEYEYELYRLSGEDREKLRERLLAIYKEKVENGMYCP